MTNDSGCAPNPYYGFCSLALCKNLIRKHAKINDYVIGFGSKTLGSFKKIIFIMKVTNKLSYDDYNKLCIQNNKHKINYGDCIYYKVGNTFKQRKNIYHNNECIIHDIKSPYVLISNDYLYFGKKSIDIPDKLTNIIPFSRGHKSKSIEYLEDDFSNWYNLLKVRYNKQILGEPHNIYLRCSFQKK